MCVHESLEKLTYSCTLVKDMHRKLLPEESREPKTGKPGALKISTVGEKPWHRFIIRNRDELACVCLLIRKSPYTLVRSHRDIIWVWNRDRVTFPGLVLRISRRDGSVSHFHLRYLILKMGASFAEWANRDLEMFSPLKPKPNLENINTKRRWERWNPKFSFFLTSCDKCNN